MKGEAMDKQEHQSHTGLPVWMLVAAGIAGGYGLGRSGIGRYRRLRFMPHVTMPSLKSDNREQPAANAMRLPIIPDKIDGSQSSVREMMSSRGKPLNYLVGHKAFEEATIQAFETIEELQEYVRTSEENQVEQSTREDYVRKCKVDMWEHAGRKGYKWTIGGLIGGTIVPDFRSCCCDLGIFCKDANDKVTSLDLTDLTWSTNHLVVFNQHIWRDRFVGWSCTFYVRRLGGFIVDNVGEQFNDQFSSMSTQYES
jgi:hypothetical protein